LRGLAYFLLINGIASYVLYAHRKARQEVYATVALCATF
jgi:hypothetical protein